MNEYRRDYHKRNPEKNSQYWRVYINKPEMVEAREAKKQARLEKAEAKQRDKLIARLYRAMLRHQKATVLNNRIKKISEESHKRQLEKEIESVRILIWKFNRLAKRLARKAEKAKTRQEALERREARIQEEIEKKQSRELQQQKLANQHGISIGDYDRCRKANITACDPCKAGAAAYIRSKKKDPKYREYRKGQNRRRDKRVRQNGFEYYNTQDILNTWGYDCHICNTPIDFSVSRQCGSPGWELSLHLDHVIPLSKGGTDTVSNVKPAHAKCNIYKSNLVLEKATV